MQPSVWSYVTCEQYPQESSLLLNTAVILAALYKYRYVSPVQDAPNVEHKLATNPLFPHTSNWQYALDDFPITEYGAHSYVVSLINAALVMAVGAIVGTLVGAMVDGAAVGLIDGTAVGVLVGVLE